MNINLFNEVKEIVKISPLLLIDKVKEDDNILNIANSLLPYSVGTEIEASYIKEDQTPNLEGLYLLAKRTSHIGNEVSFRIPNGYKGLIALELFSIELKNYLTKSDSGNHYHIDLSDNYLLLSDKIKEESEYILKELDSWDYKGTYNSRIVGKGKSKWVNLRDVFNTVEIRIGELAVDYSTLFKRISHCSEIITNVREKHDLKRNLTFDNDFNKEDILSTIDRIDSSYETYYNKYLKELNKNAEKKKDFFINQNTRQGIEFVRNKKIICY